MTVVRWESFDREDEKFIDFSPFIEKASQELDLSIKNEEILFTIDTINLKPDSKIEVVNLIETLSNLLKYNKMRILISQDDEIINTKTFHNNLEVSSVSKDGFYQIKHERKIEKLTDYKTQKPFLLSMFYLPKSIIEAKFLIPINIFDTSAIFGIKGVISTFFWFLPTYTRSEILIHKNINNRSTALLEVFSEVNKRIIFAINLLIAEKKAVVISKDVVSVDAFTSALSGIKALSIPLTKIAYKEKLGMGDIMKLSVCGEKFTKPATILQVREIDESVIIDFSKCNRCLKCVDACPFGAISLKEDILLINRNKCNKCAYCIEVCPTGALN